MIHRSRLFLTAATAALLATPLAAETIDVAIIGEPDTFDPMVSTKDVVSIVTQHFVETLSTFDETWSVVPLLAADMPDISDDGLTVIPPDLRGMRK